uniref:Immunoglobulin V-set domain-containing protein n=1 Tax=Fundulus heteroclitus TaxID=8078 RepID=A0A3Q2QSS1_FUNHE
MPSFSLVIVSFSCNILFQIIVCAYGLFVFNVPLSGPTECNLTNPSEDQHCIGALGEPLFFYLLTSEQEKTMLERNEATDFKSDNNAKYNNNYEYFTNGTLKVDKTTKNDSGIYQLEVYSSSSGILQRKIKLHLYIIGRENMSKSPCTCL